METRTTKDKYASCACWNAHTTVGWKGSQRLVIIYVVLPTIAILLPYVVAISKKAMPAFLPLISQAAGHPPMTGMFTIPLILMGFFGVINAIVLFETINQRNVKNLKILRIVNKLAYITLMVTILGFVVTGCFPVGYTDLPNKFEWAMTVLLEHSSGASMIYFGSALFHFFLTIVWWSLPDTTKIMKYFRAVLCVLYVVLFAVMIKPVPGYIAEENGPMGFDMEYAKTIKYELPIVFTTNYLICAFGEWIACTFAILNFVALYKDMKRVSFHVTIRHKSCYREIMEPSPSITTIN